MINKHLSPIFDGAASSLIGAACNNCGPSYYRLARDFPRCRQLDAVCCNLENARCILQHLVQRQRAMQASLQNKLTFGYLVVAILALGVSLYVFERIRVVEQRVLLGERIAELFDAAMEIRRFERNYFLHRQEADRLENSYYIEQLATLLEKNQADFALLGAPERVVTLRGDLARYQHLMLAYAQSANPAQRAALEPGIRAAGKDIVAVAEDAVSSERRQVRELLAAFRTHLVFAIVSLALLMIAVGQALSRRVVQPLKEMEQSVNAVQAGRRDKLSRPSQDREIVAIVDAFNQMLKELEQRQKHLMRTEKLASLGTMLSGVAHELNNPLSNIWSSCQILLEELDAADIAAQRELLMQIDSQSERASNIVRSLLDFARERAFKREALALRALVEQSIAFLKSSIPPGVRLRLDIPSEMQLEADRQRLQQALLNLIKNAVEAVGDAGDVTVAARLEHGVTEGDATVGCQVDGDYLHISVSDSGHGIPPDLLPRIFDPFFTTKDVGYGMGLGLFIVYQVIDEHGGCIFARSEPGRGATFHIRLPAASLVTTP
jgi:signal transduction histidine kinase